MHVYDFEVHPADVTSERTITEQETGASKGAASDPRRTVGRKVVNAFSERLTRAIRARGMRARRAGMLPPGSPMPGVSQNAILVRGRFVLIDAGSRSKRFPLGFGTGNSEVKSQLFIYQATTAGLRLLQEFETSASGSKKPDTAVPGVSEATDEVLSGVEWDAQRTADKVAQELAHFFAQQGWIPAQ